MSEKIGKVWYEHNTVCQYYNNKVRRSFHMSNSDTLKLNVNVVSFRANSTLVQKNPLQVWQVPRAILTRLSMNTSILCPLKTMTHVWSLPVEQVLHRWYGPRVLRSISFLRFLRYFVMFFQFLLLRTHLYSGYRSDAISLSSSMYADCKYVFQRKIPRALSYFKQGPEAAKVHGVWDFV